MKAKEIRNLTTEELRDKETDLAQQLFALRLQRVTGQIESPAKVRQARRDLARVLTVLSERRSGDQHSGSGATA